MKFARAIIPLALAAAAIPSILSAADVSVYTAAQAEKGAVVYTEQCAACHGAQLEGGLGPALKGASFQTLATTKSLNGRTLLDSIAATMPLTSPGSLSAEQYAEVTAYILKQSGYPAGTNVLSPTTAGLATLDLTKPPAGAAAAAPAALPAGARKASAGVYTAQQAEHGKAVYSENCLTCHGGELDGLEGAPPLSGKPFADRWGDLPVTAIAQYISTQMPPGNGGAVGATGETDIIAYILSKNGYPAGTTPLSADSRQQALVIIDKK